MSKTVHIHLGPHKTGSSAVQAYLRAHQTELADRFGLHLIDGPVVANLAHALHSEDGERIQISAKKLAEDVQNQSGDFILSREDLAGDLPGRTMRKRIYPRLWQNIQTLRNAIPSDVQVRFYVFDRDPDTWLYSAYVQHLKYRNRFKSFEKFKYFFKTDALWDGVYGRSRARLGSDFIELSYDETPDFSSPLALMRAILGTNAEIPTESDTRYNVRPNPEIIQILEKLNGIGASDHARQTAKAVLFESKGAATSQPVTLSSRPWPPALETPDWLAEGLTPLWSRAQVRVTSQIQPNLLPELTQDLTPMRTKLVIGPPDFPEGGRAQMENQIQILSSRFEGYPETALILALSISYLRRGTDVTEHAAVIFQRLWQEEHAFLLGILPTRWLISSFQTFMDHGVTPTQQKIGTAAYFLANTIKLYEAERAIEGQSANAVYSQTRPQTKSGFKGLDRFPVGGTDLMLNTLAHVMELAVQDDTAGRVVQEFLLRMKASHTAFTRMDAARLHHGADVPGFTNCWSFFEPPENT